MDSEKVIVRQGGPHGSGVFAVAAIAKDEVVAEFDGPMYPRGDPAWNDNLNDHAIQFAENWWRDSVGIARDVNHSCTPNCGIKNLFAIVAMRDISPGEEITWDYEMSENSAWRMDCKCGSPECRGRVGAYEQLPEHIRLRYHGYISEWLQEKPAEERRLGWCYGRRRRASQVDREVPVVTRLEQLDESAKHPAAGASVGPGVPVAPSQRDFLPRQWTSSHNSGYPFSFTLRGYVEPDVLRHALERVVHDNDAFRLMPVVRETGVLLYAYPACGPRITIADIRRARTALHPLLVDRYVELSARRAVGPAAAPPMMAWMVVRLSEGEWRITGQTHHFALDGWSESLVIDAVARDVAALGARAPSAGRRRTFASYATEAAAAAASNQTADRLQERAEMLAACQPPFKPTPGRLWLRNRRDRVRTTTTLPGVSHRRLQDTSQTAGVTVFALLIHAVAVAVRAETGARDFTIATPMANRPTAESRALIGCLATMVPIRANLGLAGHVADDPEIAMSAIVEAFGYEDIPWNRTWGALAGNWPARQSLTDLSVAFHNQPGAPEQVGDISVEHHDGPDMGAPASLSLAFWTEGDSLRCSTRYWERGPASPALVAKIMAGIVRELGATTPRAADRGTWR